MKIKGLKVFVTGGAGFIGSHIVEELLSSGANITVYDNFSSGSHENLSHIRKHINIVQGDILDFKRLKKAMGNCEVVSHHAAQLEILSCIDDPYKDLKINTEGTLNILEAAKQNRVAMVINASSACIYGQTKSKTSEDYLPAPNWPYGISKLAAEKYAIFYNNFHHLPVINLRYAITYGEREWFRRVLTIFIKRAVLGKSLVVFGDGQQIRDFIYVKDAVKLHNLCLENDSSNGQTYNVGTGTPTKIIDLAYLVSDVTEEVLGKKPSVIQEETAEGEFSKIVTDKKRNPCELMMMLLDIQKATDELNWQPKTSLKEGVKKELNWAINNLHRWKKIYYSKTKKKTKFL